MILRPLMCFNLVFPSLVWRAAQLYNTAIMEKFEVDYYFDAINRTG